jgi:CxxC motif-containing protein
MAHTKNNLGNKPLEIICVACPKGCRLGVQRENGEILVTNAGCKHGREYAVGELNDPRRMLASTVRVHNGLHPLVPVYTEAPFPKGMIPDLLKEISHVQVTAPIKCGQVIIKDALKTGIDVLASRDI